MLYMGHWIAMLMKIGVISGEPAQQIILLLASRMARAKMSSTAKVRIIVIYFLELDDPYWSCYIIKWRISNLVLDTPSASRPSRGFILLPFVEVALVFPIFPGPLVP
jgi:hypothetical protein